MDCPCGQEMKVKTEWSVRLREEVDVRSCMCGREREVIEYGPFDHITSAHDKYVLIAMELGYAGKNLQKAQGT